jgi:hypothetical protein
MKEERKELLKEWRDISWWDKLRSKFQDTPATFGKYNQAYSNFILNIVTDPNLEVVEINKYRMVVILKGEEYSFWIANYPYSYGTLKGLHTNHKWFHSEVNWEAVLKVRELQMKYKKSFFAKYDEDQKQL